MGEGKLAPMVLCFIFITIGKTILCLQSLNCIIYMALVISQLTVLKLEKAIFGKSTIFAP